MSILTFSLFATSVVLYLKKSSLFLWLAFFITFLLPTALIPGIASIVAERYAYLASVGIFIIIAFLLNLIKNNKIKWSVFAFIVLALSIRTFIRNFDYRNQDTLWLATAKTAPSSPQNHNNLGDYYGRQGDLARAVDEFKKAIELNSRYGDAHHNLANTYHQLGQDDLAIENYQKALSFNPNLWQSHQNLAAIYYSNNQLDQAKDELAKALAIVPNNQNLKAALQQLENQQTPR
jgi:tetratricopeptide (TPR) repeat protein